MKRMIGILAITLMLFAGICFATQPVKRINPKSAEFTHRIIHDKRIEAVRRAAAPDIKTDLRWEFVRYTEQDPGKAIVRLVATFTNIGGSLLRCPDPPCTMFLRTLNSAGNRVREVLAERRFSSFGAGQTVTLSKEIEVYCGQEFSPIIEAGHDVKCDPRYYIYHDPDYLRPGGYDANIDNNFKRIPQDDIERALWDYSCRPTRR